MTFKPLSLAVAVAAGIASTSAMAQDAGVDASTNAPIVAENGTSFRGIRLEGNFGGDRFQSEGNHNDKFGYGGTIGFDGTLGERVVIGAEGSFWKPGKGNENTTALAIGNSIDHKAFEEWGAAVRAGFLATPDVLIFGKAGYVNGEQRKRIEGPVGNTLVYDHYRADGYQVGGGVEFSLTQGRLPVYASAQYVYSNYHGNSSRQRVMGGIGIRFK